MLSRRLSSVLALSASLLLCQPLFASEVKDARYWLQRMVIAARTVNLSGELIYAQDTHLDTLYITRLHEGAVQRERIYSLSGPNLEILRDGRQVTRIFPADEIVMVDKSEGRRGLTDLSQDQIRQLESWYTLSLSGEDRVADRTAQRIDIQPLDEHRYGYRLWLDVHTGVLLRSQMKNIEGDVLEQFMYVNIEYDAIEHDAVNPSLYYNDFRHLSVEPAPEPDNHGHWRAMDLPDGFRRLSESWWSMPGVTEPVRHLLFGDGLSSVSVYIAPDSGKPFHGQSGHGAMHVAGRTVDDYQVTVVGDVPAGTAIRILESLEHHP